MRVRLVVGGGGGHRVRHMRLSINYCIAARNPHGRRLAGGPGRTAPASGQRSLPGAWATSATLGRANMRHTLSRVLRNAITTGGLP